MEQVIATVTENVNFINGNYLILCNDPENAFNHFIGSFKVISAAGGLVVQNNGIEKFLMIYRLGFWDLPKGKIDKGENEQQAALREVEEECGVGELSIIREINKTWHLYFHKERWVIKQTHWYLMNSNDKKEPHPQVSENITKAKWVTKEEMKNLLPLSYASIRRLIEEEIYAVE